MVFFYQTRRAAAAVLALLLICALCLSGLTARADAPASYSAELKLKLDGKDLQAKLSADQDNALLALQAQFGDEASSIDLSLFLGKQQIVLQDSLLLNGAYGINLETLAENLPNSVFAPDSGSALALDQALYDSLMAPAEIDASSVGIIGGGDGPTSMFVSGSGLVSTLLKTGKLKLAPGELELESGTVKTTDTIISFDAEGLAALADNALAGLSEEIQGKLARLLTSFFGSGEETGEDCTSLRDVLIRADARLSLSISLDKKTKQVVSANAVLSWEEQTTDLRAIFTDNFCSLTLTREDSEPLTATLNLDENTDRALAFRLCVAQGDTPDAQLSFRWDKAAGTYVFTSKNGDQTDELTGTIQISQDTAVVTADTANGQELEDIQLTLRRNDPVTLPEYQDIVTMDESGILRLLQRAITVTLTIVKEAI